MHANYPGLYVWINHVHFPKHMSVINAPYKIKLLATEKINNVIKGHRYKDQLRALLTFMNSVPPCPDELKLSTEFIKTQDNIRGTSMQAVLPDLASMLSDTVVI